MAVKPLRSATGRAEPGTGFVLAEPILRDGPELWRMARDSATLDVNSPYSYILWCRDFAATSIVARDASSEGRPCGFVTGFLRPDAPETLFVWQVAVDRAHRGQGLARRMLDGLAERLVPRGARALEATVTPDNTASTALFTSFARDQGAELTRTPLFGPDLLPGGHEPEVLFRIGPLGRG
ncbi:diaminobutyrate acetyltransferase [Actinomadura rupiterrae]|uniref:diaminobutyrate acetyltransferase n=1 Tax=Actinomadura rupiterrae TaxID=559627 RepID=UPI0020A2EF41|nr:diaminobutyrate acetyltransferase [Actinomadura rupiterrae]MCP2338153.1 L-2,4-diaminobutyric acid acetyltransferase [Actinomadura rupiterrae]